MWDCFEVPSGGQWVKQVVGAMQGVTCDGPTFSETGGAGSSRGNRGQLTIFESC